MMPKTVLITGASSGIGRALALEYAKGGAKVALVARRRELLDAVAEEVRALGGEPLVLPADVTKSETVHKAVCDAIVAFGGLDLVIANAGVGGTKHVKDTSWAFSEQMIDANVNGAIATLLAAVPHMVSRGSGQLVGVSSIAGLRALPNSAVYSASKAALSTFLEATRIDLRSSGVKVTDIQPGFVTTPATDKNNFKMPFKWPVEKAARVIVKRLQRAPSVIAFPWPLVTALRIARLLPDAVYDRLVGAADPRGL